MPISAKRAGTTSPRSLFTRLHIFRPCQSILTSYGTAGGVNNCLSLGCCDYSEYLIPMRIEFVSMHHVLWQSGNNISEPHGFHQRAI
jgi:hypothetical protein